MANKMEIQHYPELGGAQAFDMVWSSGELRAYCPDAWHQTRKWSRCYLWMLLATLRPEYTNRVLSHAQSLRH